MLLLETTVLIAEEIIVEITEITDEEEEEDVVRLVLAME